jgi:hypothetical protein
LNSFRVKGHPTWGGLFFGIDLGARIAACCNPDHTSDQVPDRTAPNMRQALTKECAQHHDLTKQLLKSKKPPEGGFF